MRTDPKALLPLFAGTELSRRDNLLVPAGIYTNNIPPPPAPVYYLLDDFGGGPGVLTSRPPQIGPNWFSSEVLGEGGEAPTLGPDNDNYIYLNPAKFYCGAGTPKLSVDPALPVNMEVVIDTLAALSGRITFGLSDSPNFTIPGQPYAGAQVVMRLFQDEVVIKSTYGESLPVSGAAGKWRLRMYPGSYLAELYLNDTLVATKVMDLFLGPTTNWGAFIQLSQQPIGTHIGRVAVYNDPI